jgi:hypothetical protein
LIIEATMGQFTAALIKINSAIELSPRNLSGAGGARLSRRTEIAKVRDCSQPPPATIQAIAGAGVKLAEPVIKEAGIKLEEDKAYEGAGGGGKLKIVPYVVNHLSFGDIKEENVAGLYDGPFPWENAFGFRLAGMVGHDFFKPYAVTFDFDTVRIFLR